MSIMENEVFAEAALPLVTYLYNICRKKLYSILDTNRKEESLNLEYIYSPFPSQFVYASLFDHVESNEYGISHTILLGDTVLIERKENRELEDSLVVTVVFFEPFILYPDYNETRLDHNVIKDVIHSLVLVGNYCPSRFGEEIVNRIKEEENPIGPYMAFLDKKGVVSELGFNPFGKDYEDEEHGWAVDPDENALIVRIPFRIVNEAAYRPEGKEYERIRKTTHVGKPSHR